MQLWTISSVFCVAALYAQAPQQPEPALVNLNVVALDSRGQPVTDLTAGDFTVTDAGKPRSIAFMHHIDRRLEPQPALGPNQFSNRSGDAIPHATVILLDLMNMRFNTRSLAANQIVKQLQNVESADYLYLYFLTIEGRVFPVRGLPDPEGAGASQFGGPTWTRGIKTIMDNAMKTVLRTRPIDEDVAVRTQLTYRALETLAAQLEVAPGRKNIVWVTDGVPLTLGPIRSDTGDVVDFTPLLRHLSEALDQARISIYPSRQIMIGSQDAPGDAPGVPRSAAENGVLSSETLDQFAQMTGGRPNTGRDVGAVVAQAMIDARTSYEIGYYAPLENWDGKFHKLRVACNRKGVRLQTKTGYYAWPRDPADAARRAMQIAIGSASDSAEIGIRASLTGTRLDISIDARDIAFTQDSGKYKGELRLAVVDYGPNGTPHPAKVESVDVDLTPAQHDKVMAEGLNYGLDVPKGGDVDSIRFIAYDEIAQSVGSITIAPKRAK